jgi:hypothetical protein
LPLTGWLRLSSARAAQRSAASQSRIGDSFR